MSQIANGSSELLPVDWLGQIRGVAALERSLTIVRPRKRRHSDSRNPTAARTNAPNELVAVDVGHCDVGDDHTYELRLKYLQRRFGRVAL